MHPRNVIIPLIGLAWLAMAAPAAPLPPHPRLTVNAAEIAALRQRIQREPWAQREWATILRSADSALKADIDLPPRGGSYYHFYIDPVNGAPLSRGQEVGPWQWEHRGSDGKLYRGDPKNPRRDYDGYVILEIHQLWTRRARDLGLAYQVTGEKRYADQCRAILLAYADLYPKLPRRNHYGLPWPNSGRIATHMLSEAVWLIPAVQGADLIWDTLSAAQRKTIADRVFLPCVNDILIPQDRGSHNRQCWKNTAVGLTGLLLGDDKLIAEALDQPNYGHRALMKQGVSDSGFWHEGSWSYHSYTLSALLPLTEAARLCGINLYDDQFKGLFDAPFRLSAPSGALPAFNDSSEGKLVGFARFCELAHARYRDPAYLALLDPRRRSGELALLYGVAELPEPRPVTRLPANFSQSGYAILTAGTGQDATWLCLKYGPHGGGHGHPDKASFVLYARGRQLAIDPGMALYGAPIHAGWYRATLAHNTLVIDESSQSPATGKSLAYGDTYAVIDAGPIASGVRFTRSVAMLGPQVVIFIDQIEADQERQFDIAYHPHGQWLDLPKGDAFTPPDRPGYRYLTAATQRGTDQDLALAVRVDKDWVSGIVLAGGAPTTVITATGVGAQLKQQTPAVLFRRHARQTTYIWGVTLDGGKLSLRPCTVQDEQGKEVPSAQAAAVQARTGAGENWLLLTNRTGQAVRVMTAAGRQAMGPAPYLMRKLED